MSSKNLVYFLSGGNKGVGLSIVKKLSTRPKTTVITTARNPEAAIELQELIKSHSNVHLIKYDASNQDVSRVVEATEKIAGEGIDVFISNSATESAHLPVLEEKPNVWVEHYKINALGPILLTQGLYPLLAKKETRKIVYVSTAMASMGSFIGLDGSAYSQSKASLNFAAKLLSFELREQKFTIVPIHPGLIDNAIGQGILERLEVRDPKAAANLRTKLISADESASHIIELVDDLTVEKNGKFINYDGSEWAY